MNAGQKQARVAEPVSATRGSQSALHCGLPGFEPSLSKTRRVASSPYTRVGCEDIRARVLLAICNHPSQIFQSDFLSCKRRIIQNFEKNKYLRCEKYLRSRADAAFTQRIFLFPRRVEDCVRLDLRALKPHLRSYKFRMLTNPTLVCPGNCFTSTDP